MAFLHNFKCSCGWEASKPMPAGPDGLMMGRLDPFWYQPCGRVWTRFTRYEQAPEPQVCRSCGLEAEPWPCKCPKCGGELENHGLAILAD
jgi:hypothetical protein